MRQSDYKEKMAHQQQQQQTLVVQSKFKAFLHKIFHNQYSTTFRFRNMSFPLQIIVLLGLALSACQTAHIDLTRLYEALKAIVGHSK